MFEGIDGTGKGTMAALAAAYLREKLGNLAVVETKEPGGTPFGLRVRELIFTKRASDSDPVPMGQLTPGVVDLMFLASHIQNWKTVVEPALNDGKIVVSDRWWYSQFAFMTQRFVPRPVISAYVNARGGNADLLFFLYGDPKTVVDRARARTVETHQTAKIWNDYTQQTAIQQAYFQQFSPLPEWFPVNIDGKDVDATWEIVRRKLDDFFGVGSQEQAEVRQ